MATVYLSIGTNVNREHNLSSGLTALHETFGELRLSSLFESEAVGFLGSPFYNMVVGFTTLMSVEQLSEKLRNIEFEHGRELEAKKFSPRTLDLDILLYDDLVSKSPVQLPREEITFNAFVLWPLSEVAGDIKHPILNERFYSLWQAFDKNTQRLRKVPLKWTFSQRIKEE